MISSSSSSLQRTGALWKKVKKERERKREHAKRRSELQQLVNRYTKAKQTDQQRMEEAKTKRNQSNTELRNEPRDVICKRERNSLNNPWRGAI